MKDVKEDAPQDVAQDLASGARAVCTSPRRHHRSRCLRRYAEMGIQEGRSVAFGSGSR